MTYTLSDAIFCACCCEPPENLCIYSGENSYINELLLFSANYPVSNPVLTDRVNAMLGLIWRKHWRLCRSHTQVAITPGAWPSGSGALTLLYDGKFPSPVFQHENYCPVLYPQDIVYRQFKRNVGAVEYTGFYGVKACGAQLNTIPGYFPGISLYFPDTNTYYFTGQPPCGLRWYNRLQLNVVVPSPLAPGETDEITFNLFRFDWSSPEDADVIIPLLDPWPSEYAGYAWPWVVAKIWTSPNQPPVTFGPIGDADLLAAGNTGSWADPPTMAIIEPTEPCYELDSGYEEEEITPFSAPEPDTSPAPSALAAPRIGPNKLKRVRKPCVHLGQKMPNAPCGSTAKRCNLYGDITTQLHSCPGANRSCMTCPDYKPYNG